MFKKVFLAGCFASALLAFFVLLTPTTSAAGLAQLAGCSGPDCGTCEIIKLANGLIMWFIGFVFLLFALLLMRAGVKLVTSGGNPGALQDAKDSFINALVGFIIILSAWLIVDTVMRTLVGDERSGALVWSQIECTAQVTPDECTEANGCRVEVALESLEFEQESLTSGCMGTNLSTEQLQALGCRFDPCTTTSCLTSCMNVVQGSQINQSAGNYCATGSTNTQGTSVTPVAPSGMVSLKSLGVNVANWQGINGPGRTDRAHPRAAQAALAMQNSGKAKYGKTPFQVTAAYTNGVGHSANSKHYQGIAIDFQPINGVTLAQVAQLAREAGFAFVLIESRHVHADMR